MKLKQIINENTSTFLQAAAYRDKPCEVSVIMPTYNKQADGFLKRAVQSVLEQDFKNLELIIIDDASEDKTPVELGKLCQSDSRISVITHKANIALPALSTYEGFLKAKGEYIAFIFDDTAWDKSFISQTLRYMKYNSFYASYGILNSYYGTQENDFISYGNDTNGLLCEELLSKPLISLSSLVVHKSVFDKVGFFDCHLSLTKDYPWDMLLRISRDFELSASGIFCANEISVTQNNKLSRETSHNKWCVCEQMNRQRDLSIENYPEYEIDSLAFTSSELFDKMLNKRIDECSKKEWFKSFERAEVKTSARTIRKVLIAYSDSLVLSRCPFIHYNHDDKDICYNFVFADEMTREDLLYADACIFLGDSSKIKASLQRVKSLNIACFLYMDSYSSIEDYTDLSDFKAVFIPSEGCNKKLTYDINTIVLSDVFDKRIIKSYNELDKRKQITFALYNETNERALFEKKVMPVLCELSEKYDICVVLDKDLSNDNKYSAYKNIKLAYSKKRASVNACYLQAHSFHPQFIIDYKNDSASQNTDDFPSALIQSTLLGSVLLSNDTRYSSSNNSERSILLNENENDIFHTIEEAITNSQRHLEIYNNALSFLSEEYDMKTGKTALKKEIIKATKPHEDYNKSRLSVLYYDEIDTDAPKPDFEKLKKSAGIRRKREYKLIKCTKEPLFGVGVIIEAKNEGEKLSGSAKMSLIRTNGDTITSEILLKDIKDKTFTYFKFEPTDGTLFEDLSVIIEFNYDSKGQRACLYENKEARKLKTILTQALNMKVAGRNVLLYDIKGEKDCTEI